MATFIVQKILLDETGLAYICATAERFYAVSTVLGARRPDVPAPRHTPPLSRAAAARRTAAATLPPYPPPRAAGNLVGSLVDQPSARLLKHIVRCYLRLSDNPRAREALRQCLPDVLRDATFSACLKDDVTTKRWLTQLLFNITESTQHVQ